MYQDSSVRDVFCRNCVPYTQPDMGQAPFAICLQVYEQSEAQSIFQMYLLLPTSS